MIIVPVSRPLRHNGNPVLALGFPDDLPAGASSHEQVATYVFYVYGHTAMVRRLRSTDELDEEES